MKTSFIRLNWRAYLPADEREYELYSIAYRRSYSFLVGVLISVPGFYKIASINSTLPASLIFIFLLVYTLVGFILAEFVGSRVFVGHDVSFSKKRPAIGMGEGTWSGFAILFGFMFVAFVFVTVAYLATHLN